MSVNYNRVYERRRRQNRDIHEVNRRYVFANCPEAERIMRDIAQLVADASIHSPTDGALLQAAQRIKRLREALSDALAKCGIDEHMLDPLYDCAVCHDTGAVNGKPCKCRDAILVDYLRQQSGLNTQHTFAAFDITLFSDKPHGELKSPRDNMNQLLTDAIQYANGTSNIDHLYYYGDPGLGKTYLSECIANRVIERGNVVFYISAPRLFAMLDKIRFDRNAAPELRLRADLIYDADLLIIDDLGTEVQSSVASSNLFDIINTRTNNRKRMIINTNMRVGDLRATYTERILSRITGYFETCHFYGKDLRFGGMNL